jgi:hypothetical protein
MCTRGLVVREKKAVEKVKGVRARRRVSAGAEYQCQYFSWAAKEGAFVHAD